MAGGGVPGRALDAGAGGRNGWRGSVGRRGELAHAGRGVLGAAGGCVHGPRRDGRVGGAAGGHAGAAGRRRRRAGVRAPTKQTLPKTKGVSTGLLRIQQGFRWAPPAAASRRGACAHETKPLHFTPLVLSVSASTCPACCSLRTAPSVRRVVFGGLAHGKCWVASGVWCGAQLLRVWLVCLWVEVVGFRWAP